MNNLNFDLFYRSLIAWAHQESGMKYFFKIVKNQFIEIIKKQKEQLLELVITLLKNLCMDYSIQLLFI